MEYFSIFSHGQLLDNKKLDPVDRKLNNEYIPIIMFGTQSHITQHGFTLFYYITALSCSRIAYYGKVFVFISYSE